MFTSYTWCINIMFQQWMWSPKCICIIGSCTSLSFWNKSNFLSCSNHQPFFVWTYDYCVIHFICIHIWNRMFHFILCIEIRNLKVVECMIPPSLYFYQYNNNIWRFFALCITFIISICGKREYILHLQSYVEMTVIHFIGWCTLSIFHLFLSPQ